MNKKRALRNLTTLLRLEREDQKLAIRFVSQPNIDRKELSEIIESSLAGVFTDDLTGKTLRLNDKTSYVGMLNILALDRIERRKD